MTQRPNWFLFATAVVAGCRGCGEHFPSGDSLSDTDDTGETIVERCCSGIKGTPVPANGSTDVTVRGTFSVEFIYDESSSAVFTLTDSADADVPLGDVHFSDHGRSAWFQAAAPLQPSTSYTLTRPLLLRQVGAD